MKKGLLIQAIFILLIGIFNPSCTTVREEGTSERLLSETTMEFQKPEKQIQASQTTAVQKAPESLPAEGEFIPAEEEISPLNETVSISVSSAPLKDVLRSIADTVDLNLVMQKGVDPNTPITLSLRDVTAREAIDIILSSTDYFYDIEGNILYVKATDTRVYEFGHTSVIQRYDIDVGGDILGGGGGTETSQITGKVSLRGTSAEEHMDIWKAVEKGLKQILDSSDSGQSTTASFSINRMTGTIVVTGTKVQLKKVEKYLNRLKQVLNRQVIIEARIVEVRLNEGLRYGINWDSLGNLTYGFRAKFNNFAEIVKSEEPNIELSITRFNFNALMRALEEMGEVRVLSNPRVNLMNGQIALLTVGRSVNIISRVEITTTATTAATSQTTFSTETENLLSGIIIGIAPYIHEDGTVSMTITPIISELVSLERRQIGEVGQNKIELTLPTVDLRELSTTVRVRDGEMVLIGGLISTKEETKDYQVPFFGRIPIIGSIFKSHSSGKSRSELVIMLKPTIVSGRRGV
jgi:MSHA type pilus biogenesis protein MshL